MLENKLLNDESLELNVVISRKNSQVSTHKMTESERKTSKLTVCNRWDFMEASIFIWLMILPFEAHDLRMKERLLILKRKVWLSPNEEKEKKVIWKKKNPCGELNPGHGYKCWPLHHYYSVIVEWGKILLVLFLAFLYFRFEIHLPFTTLIWEFQKPA